MPIFHILSHHHQFNSKSNSHSQHGFNLNLSLSLNPNQKSNPSLSLSLILSLNMKSSYTSPDIENHYWSTKKERSNSRFGLILLWLLVLTSIFTFFTLYSPNPFNLIPKQERFNEWNSLLNKPITDEHDNCDLFKGRWIPDLNGPLYTNKSCPMMPDSKNCGKHGRKDVDYMNWRWKPDGCELPRFDHKKFFSMVKGKKMAFIGDSVARNQMESLLCLLSQEEMPVDIYKDSEDRYRTWYFPSHNFTLMVFWVKYLITGEERVINGSLSGFYDLYLDKIETAWTEKLPGLDYAIISDAHWFFRKLYLHDGDKLIGCVYCDEPNITQISVSFAVQSAYRVALKYINECKECGNLISFVRTFAPAHFEYGTWNGGGICNRTSPYSEGEVNLQGSEWELRTSQVHQVKRAKKEAREKSTGKRFESLDITRAMVMRPDGHPGPHWDNQYMKGYNDCLHWCLPGPIDVWNDLLLAVLSKVHGLSLH